MSFGFSMLLGQHLGWQWAGTSSSPPARPAGGRVVDDNRIIIAMEIILVMSRCPWAKLPATPIISKSRSITRIIGTIRRLGSFIFFPWVEKHQELLKVGGLMATWLIVHIISSNNIMVVSKKCFSISAGLEPAIFCSVGRRVIHCATRPLVFKKVKFWILLFKSYKLLQIYSPLSLNSVVPNQLSKTFAGLTNIYGVGICKIRLLVLK